MRNSIRKYTAADGTLYIAATDVAAILGYATSTLRKWANAGKVKFQRHGFGGGASPSYFVSLDSLYDCVGERANEVAQACGRKPRRVS